MRQPPASFKVEAPNQSLRRKLGGSARTIISPAMRAEAARALEAVAAQIRPKMLEELVVLEEMSRARPFNAPSEILIRAERIRGLAGSCGLPGLGQAADAMCKMLDGVEDGDKIDANLLTSIAVTMMHAAKRPDDDPAMLQELISACHEAVEQQRGEP